MNGFEILIIFCISFCIALGIYLILFIIMIIISNHNAKRREEKWKKAMKLLWGAKHECE